KAVSQFDRWRKALRPKLVSFGKGDHPKELIHLVSESLLLTMQSVPILDPYAIYQHLMDYWAETMQDDCYLLSAEGWVAETCRVVETGKGGKTKDRGWTCDLVPKPLVVARFFVKEQAEIDELRVKLETVSASLAEFEEEHGSEGGLLFEAQDEKGGLTKGSVKARLVAAIEGGTDVAEPGEIPVLKKWLKLSTAETELKRSLRAAEAQLDLLAYEKYPQLSVKEIQTLVVDDKWLATLAAVVQCELDGVSQTLTGRIRQLADRYATPLPELEAEIAALAAKVEMHLKRMEGARA
ncbi:MAG TPA: type I restriction endonuclease subunit M, partial [Bacteroidia bacterium]|nr:type I restriction endonuclease subunit M [Bacteroidia bacterium]